MSDQTPPPGNPYAAAPPPMSPADEKLWSTLIHIGWLAGSIVGLPFVPAIIGYLVLKDRGPYVRQHTAAALNFQLSWLIWAVALVVVSVVSLGFGALLFLPFGIAFVVLTIVDAMRAHRGETPLAAMSIRFVS